MARKAKPQPQKKNTEPPAKAIDPQKKNTEPPAKAIDPPDPSRICAACGGRLRVVHSERRRWPQFIQSRMQHTRVRLLRCVRCGAHVTERLHVTEDRIGP